MKIGLSEKMTAVVFGGAVASVVIYVLQLFSLPVTPELSNALTIIVMSLAGWLKKEHPSFPISVDEETKGGIL